MQTEPQKHKRHWYRFSLRTLMITVSLVCCIAAFVNSRANRQKRAVERIRAVRGLVLYDYQLNSELKVRSDDPEPPGPR